MGLLDPQTLGLLMAAGAGLEASGPSRTPVSMGQVFGRGLLAGVGGYRQGMQDETQQKMTAAQLTHMGLQNKVAESSLAYQEQQRALALAQLKARQGIFGDPGLSAQDALAGGGGPTQANADRIRPADPYAMNPAGVQNYLRLGGDPKVIESYQGLGPQGQLGKINPSDYTPESFAQFMSGGGASVLRPRTKVELTPGGEAYDPYATKPGASFANPNQPFSLGPDGKIVANTAFQQFKINESTARRPQNTVNNIGPKAFESELGKIDAKQLGDWREAALSGQQTLGIVQNLRSAEAQGAYSGGGAQVKTAVANLINGLTGATPKGLAGSQLFTSDASKLVLEKVKSLGANPSNADRDFIEKTVPMLESSPEARTAMINFIEKKANEQIDLYQRADTHARANHGLGGFNPMRRSTDGSVLDAADAILKGNKP